MSAPIAMPALLALAAAAPAVSLVSAPEVRLATRDIRLGDVADLAELPPQQRARLAGRVVATLPDGRGAATLSRSAVASLVRRAVPGLAVTVAADGAQAAIRFVPPSAGAGGADAACLALTRPVAAGEMLSAADMAAAPCAARRSAAPTYFDRTDGVVRAAADLAAGTPLGRIALPAAPLVRRGEPMILASTAGAVRIERRVTAMQPGRAGQRLFVRDSDGDVLAAPLAPADSPGAPQ